MGTTTTTNIGYTKPDQAEKNTIVFQNNNWDLADLLAGQTVGKNVLINSNFPTNQRGVSGSVVLASGEYGHDRMKAGSGGCTYTFATSQNITTITISAGTLIQEVLGENLQTDTYILSWQGTATGRINVAGFTVSPQTASLTGGTNAIIEFGTGTLILPKLEIGTIATTNIPSLDKDELDDSQYTFQVLHDSTISTAHPIGIGTARQTTEIRGTIVIPTKLRVNPTHTLVGVGAITVKGNATANVIANGEFNITGMIGDNHIAFNINTSAVFTVNEIYTLSFSQLELHLDSEV